MQTLLQDLRYSLLIRLKNPCHTLASLLIVFIFLAARTTMTKAIEASISQQQRDARRSALQSIAETIMKEWLCKGCGKNFACQDRLQGGFSGVLHEPFGRQRAPPSTGSARRRVRAGRVIPRPGR